MNVISWLNEPSSARSRLTAPIDAPKRLVSDAGADLRRCAGPSGVEAYVVSH